MTIFQHNSSLSGFNSEVVEQIAKYHNSEDQDKLDHANDLLATNCFFYCNEVRDGKSKLLIMQYKASIGLTSEQFFSAYS